MSYWIDSHCHMNDPRFSDNFSEYVQHALDNQVGLSNIICMNKEEFLYTLKLKEQYSNLDISFGFYPEDVDKVTQEDLDFLQEALEKYPFIKGVGEIGLDYHNGKEMIQEQKQLFIRQIEIANKFGKPIMIHTREASQDTYDILKEYAKTDVLLHCFSESHEMMKNYIRLGYYFSFSGIVTFKNAKEPQLNASTVPLNRILIETDSPYLAPVPMRGKTNETAYVAYVGKFIANLRNMSEEELQQCIMENYQRLGEKHA